MSEAWTARVAEYLDQLQPLAETMDLILDQLKLQTTEVRSPQVIQLTEQLQLTLSEMEEKIAEREGLLQDPQAPAAGVTLIAKLIGTESAADAALARRCRQLSKLIQASHQRALSLFVCQYNLAALTGDLVRLMAGAETTKTYGPGAKQNATRGGGLFNEAA